MQLNKRWKLDLETLERRDCPTPLNFFFDGAGNLTISGTPDPIGLSVEVNAPNLVTILDGVTPVLTSVPVAGNINVRTGGTNDLVGVLVAPGATIGGNLSIDTGGGDDAVLVLGADGSIGGDVVLSNFEASPGGGITNLGTFFTIGGSVRVNALFNNTGLAFDISGVTIGRDVSLQTGNGDDDISISGSFIGGNVSSMQGNFVLGQTFNIDSSSIGGSLSYLGGSGGPLGNELVSFDTAFIGRSANVNLGSGFGTNTFQFSAGSLIGGSLTVFGGAGDDDLSAFDGDVAGGVMISLGGGTNSLSVTGALTGAFFNYLGGSGADSVNFAPAAGSASPRIYALLGAGDDAFNLDTTNALPVFGFIDFGSGADTFTSLGSLLFPLTLRNL